MQVLCTGLGALLVGVIMGIVGIVLAKHKYSQEKVNLGINQENRNHEERIIGLLGTIYARDSSDTNKEVNAIDTAKIETDL